MSKRFNPGKPEIFSIAVLIILLACGCTRKGPEAVTGAARHEEPAKARTVNLGIWASYLAPETLARFEQQTGIKVQVSNFASNEELLAKMQAGGSAYDVVVPSDYMIFAMVKLGLLQLLDYSQIPNAKGVDARYKDKSFDPENKYSIPYDWGTTGIAYNTTVYKGEIKGWNDLFTKPDLAGKFTMLDDVRETMGAALKALGYSLNSKDPKQLAEAKALLLKVRPRIKGFTPDPILTLRNGEAAITHNYSTNALQSNKAMGGIIRYVLPVEGGTLWLDNLVIPAAAPHKKEALALINFLLEPKTVVQTVLSVFVAPTEREVLSLLPKELLASHALFPTEADLSKFETIEDLGDTIVAYDRAWTELKAGRD